MQHVSTILPNTVDIVSDSNLHTKKYTDVLVTHEVRNNILNNSLPPLPESVQCIVDALRPIFNRYNEYRVVGHKGDHAHNLQNRGLVPKIDLLHVDRTLGTEGRHLSLPEGGWESYEWLLSSINSEMRGEVERIVKERKKVLILMPFPNLGLERIIEDVWATELITLSCSVPWWQFMDIEDKIEFARMVDQLELPNIIPRKILSSSDTYEWLMAELYMQPWDVYYVQKKLSGWGDGTRIICTEQDFQQVMEDRKIDIVKWNIKITKGISCHNWIPAYPMNWSGCIISDGKWEVLIYADHPSHKPVGLPELGGKTGSWNGNDRTSPLPYHIVKQYISMAKTIGHFLHKEHNYKGLYWPDWLRTLDKYYINEVNPRTQWTTPYQTLNALMNNRIPIELLHYIALFSETHPELLHHLPDPDLYNAQVEQETWGFYVKLGVKEPFTIVNDISGPWIYNENIWELIRVPANLKSLLTPEMVYMRRSGEADIEEYLATHNVVWIKCPKKWTAITPWPTPFGYIMGSWMSVFKTNTPTATEDAISLYDKIIALIKGH